MIETAVNYFSKEDVAYSFAMQCMMGGESNQARIIRKVLSGQLKFFAPTRGMMVNLGCGTGYDIPYFANEFSLKKVHALDSSKIMIDILKGQSFDIDVSTQIANLLGGHIDLYDEEADLVISTSTTPYLESLENFLSESSRVLKKNGVLAFDAILHKEESLDTIPVNHENSDVLSYYYSFNKILLLAKRKRMTVLAKVKMNFNLRGPSAEHVVIFMIKN